MLKTVGTETWSSTSNPDVWIDNAQGPIDVWNEVDDLTCAYERLSGFVISAPC